LWYTHIRKTLEQDQRHTDAGVRNELMHSGKKSVTSGIPYLDRLLGSDIFIGDKVARVDDAGILAPVFSLTKKQIRLNCETPIWRGFIQRSIKQSKNVQIREMSEDKDVLSPVRGGVFFY
jgi:hypothetical protein